MILRGIKSKKVKRVAPGQSTPEATTARIQAALERLRDKNIKVLCKVPSSNASKPAYGIVLGSNNTVYCTCDGFKYRSECRHMERFRKEFQTQTLI